MKKIFLIFVCFLILVSCLVLPSFASMPSKYGEYPNYLNSNRYTSARFYTNSTEYTDEYFFQTYLKPNTTYTFYSTSGTRRLFIGQNIIYNNYSSTLSFDSKNLFVFNDGSYNEDGLSYTIENGVFTFNGTITNSAFIHLRWVNLEVGDYYLMGFTNDNTNDYRLFMYNNQDTSWYSYGNASGKTITSDRVNEFILRFDAGTYTDLKVYPMLVKGDEYGEFIQGYMNPIYNDEFTYVYNFTTPSSISTDTPILVGINDITEGSLKNLFSREQAFDGSIPSNDFYLIEGNFSPDELANIDLESSYNSGYNSGYDDGYKIGENDGLSSSSILRSIIFTILSTPFVIVSNVLNFEFLGINIYNLVKVSITVLLIAWVITRLKGRE